MKYRILIIFLIFSQLSIYGQYQISGTVVSEENKPINKVQIYNETGGLLAQTGSLVFQQKKQLYL